jgi:phospholipase/carboxylesterase
VLLLRPDVLAGAILFRAMLPLDHAPHTDLTGRPVLITSGLRDLAIPAESANKLAALLSAAGAQVEHKTFPVAHELSQLDIAAAKHWLAPFADIP